MTWMLGLAVVPPGAGLQFLAMPVFLYTAALAVLSSGEAPGADRRAAAGLAATLLSAALMMFIVLVAAGRLTQPLVLAGVALGAAPLLYGLRDLRRGAHADAAATLRRRLQFGLIPLDILLVFGTGHWVAAAALLLLLGAAVRVFARPRAAD